jgi:hypothetical protein
MSSLPTTSLCDETPSSTSSSKDPTIASQVFLCLRLFDSAIISLAKAQTAGLPSDNLRDQLGRFRLWSNEVGAHNGFLQHRLCDVYDRASLISCRILVPSLRRQYRLLKAKYLRGKIYPTRMGLIPISTQTSGQSVLIAAIIKLN